MIYDLIAPIYDSVNSEINYSKWADFIEKIVKQELKVPCELALDLGCGTGRMTIELAKRGYDMTGVDYSPEMLDAARREAEDAGLSGKILWLLQDIREFELYGTVELAVSCLDTVNHLTDNKSLDKFFSLVHNYLIPDGIFIFDVNGKGKFQRVYSDKSYVMEEENSFCVWQNYYNEKSGICDFYITLFSEDSDGRYVREDELQREKAYSINTLKRHLIKNGFEFIGAYSDFDFNAADDGSDRIYIVARCKK